MSPSKRTSIEQLSDSEDWTKLTDISQRRRIQNRIAQRNRRKKLKSLEADERGSNQKSASAFRSPPSTPGLDGFSKWPMSFQDTKDLLSQIDQTRSRLNDYLSGLSHGTRVQPTSQQCFWDSSNVPDFDVNELNALSQSLDQLDPEFDLETFNVALDESCFDYAMTQNGPINTHTFSEPLITPPLTLTPGSSKSNLDDILPPPYKSNSPSPRPETVSSGTDHHGNTALHIAAQKGHQAIIRLLVESGLNIDATNSSGMTALQLAITAANTATVQSLLELGSNVMQTSLDGRTVLHLAVKTGDLALFQLLLQYSVDVNARDQSGETALHTAVALGHEEIVRAMLARGINTQARVGIPTPVDATFDWNMMTEL